MNHFKETISIILLYYISGTLQYSRDNNLVLTWTEKSEIYSEDKLNNIAFFDTFAGKSNHTFAVFKCSDFSATYPGRCILTMRTHYFGNHVYTKSCEVKYPEGDNKAAKYAGLTFLRGDRILILWKEDHHAHGRRMAFQVIATNDCAKSDFIHGDGHLSIEDIPNIIIRHKDTFDIIFKDPINCFGSVYCKVTYDYNGEPVYSVPKPFSSNYLSPPDSKIEISGVFPMRDSHPDDVVIVAHLGHKESAFSENVYSSSLGWVKADELIRGSYSYSNTNGFSTLCWQPGFHKTRFRCKWLDGSRELNLDFGYYSRLFPKIYNTEDGNLMLVMAGRGVDRQRLVIEKTLGDNKCERLAEVAIIDMPDFIEFSVADNDRLCLSLVSSTHKESLYDSQTLKYTYNFTTTCMKANNYHGRQECANKFLVA